MADQHSSIINWAEIDDEDECLGPDELLVRSPRGCAARTAFRDRASPVASTARSPARHTHACTGCHSGAECADEVCAGHACANDWDWDDGFSDVEEEECTAPAHGHHAWHMDFSDVEEDVIVDAADVLGPSFGPTPSSIGPVERVPSHDSERSWSPICADEGELQAYAAMEKASEQVTAKRKYTKSMRGDNARVFDKTATKKLKREAIAVDSGHKCCSKECLR